MDHLRMALREIAEDDSASALLTRSTMFLQQFVRTYCSARKECSKAVEGDCPLDAHAGGIGEVMAELDRVGQMLNAVNADLGKAAHHAESSSDS
jgi:hypothetical protein